MVGEVASISFDWRNIYILMATAVALIRLTAHDEWLPALMLWLAFMWFFADEIERKARAIRGCGSDE